MNLQPLYDVEERLEYAAIAGVSLLGEDFRLQRAVEGLKPLAAASPAFGKIDVGLTKLLAAPQEQRPSLLLDVLALVDAVAYTQARTGAGGDLEPLSVGGGVYRQISYGQINPLLTALTTTGGGRMEIIKSAWENHPEFFEDYRVLPAVVAGLGDSYGEIAELNATLLKKLGPSIVPTLKKNFDPAGKKEMARRVDVIAALEGAQATAWLRDILPDAKKDVRVAVITALGNDPGNTALLLDLVKTERSGGSREAALQALALQNGAEVCPFWTEELKKNSGSVRFLTDADEEWAAQLLASGLREQLEEMLAKGGGVSEEDQRELSSWCQAVGKKDFPVMLDFWRWADSHMEEFDTFTNGKGNPIFVGVRLTDTLRDCLRHTGPGPLRDYCLELFGRRPEMTRYLQISFHAALLSRPAAEVYEKYSPCVLTRQPILDKERKETLSNVLLRAMKDVTWSQECGAHILAGSQPTAQPLDPRWVGKLIQAVGKPATGQFYPFGGVDAVNGFDKALMDLANPTDPDQCAQLVPYLRKRMVETGSWYSYSHYLLRFGSSPRGVLGKAMVKNPSANRLYCVWQLMHDAYQVLPVEETIALLEEFLATGAGQKQAQPHFQKAIPWTIEQLRAGQPFPSNIDWSKM